ncbi:MAG: putative DNA binding domain-containing protein [Theionarchaea archaeon]|nr:putative DNA binding domain-containing protein [Theionarchaea archaeon]
MEESSLKYELLKLNDRVDIALQLGESHFREFKSGFEGPGKRKKPRNPRDICVDIAETLVAFANADGGELIVGVEDDGTVTGLDFTEEKISMFLNSPKTHVHGDTPLPALRASRLLYKDRIVLYFSVPKGTDYVYLTSNGRCLQRKDRASGPISTERISFSRTERASREYDRCFVDNASIADLDIQLIHQVAEHISKGMGVEKCLQHLELAEFDGSHFRLRRAALLLFAENPSKWHPRLQVRILKIAGNEIGIGKDFNVVTDEEVTDNILSLIESSWDLLRPHLTETRFSKHAIFRTQIIYPELACREALINAIAHRDYSMEGRGIEVHVCSNRLEIISPGALLSSIRIEDLKELRGIHQSRNSLVAKVLREVGYMRELGEGIRRMYELMHDNDLSPPELYTDSSIFKVTLLHKYIYSREERIWLENFEELNLSREQKTVVRLGYNDRLISPKEIWDAVGIVDTDYYRQLLESLYELGILSRPVSHTRAFNLAKREKKSVKNIPQFRVSLPGEISENKRRLIENTDYAKVYVGNVPYSVDEFDLQELFGIYGEIEVVSIPKYYGNESGKGFAFIEFSHKDAADRAISDSGKIRLGGQTLYVQKFIKRTQRKKSVNDKHV